MIDQRENICHGLFVLANDKPSRGDSCPGNGFKYKLANAVRCCSMDGLECITPEGCTETTLFKIAKNECSAMGMRLCTPVEMATGRCCESDRDCKKSDNILNWQSKYYQLL